MPHLHAQNQFCDPGQGQNPFLDTPPARQSSSEARPPPVGEEDGLDFFSQEVSVSLSRRERASTEGLIEIETDPFSSKGLSTSTSKRRVSFDTTPSVSSQGRVHEAATHELAYSDSDSEDASEGESIPEWVCEGDI